jgi:acyl carrier protein
MEKTIVIEKLRAIVKPYVQNHEAFDSMNEQTDLLKDLKINSAHLVDIILDTEEAFDIEIDDDSAERMLTVKDAVEIISSRLAT